MKRKLYYINEGSRAQHSDQLHFMLIILYIKFDFIALIVKIIFIVQKFIQARGKPQGNFSVQSAGIGVQLVRNKGKFVGKFKGIIRK